MLGAILTLITVRSYFKNTAHFDFKPNPHQFLLNPPTKDKPITITPSKLELQSSQTGLIKVHFLNTGAEDFFKLTVSEDSCTDVIDAEIIYKTQPLSVAAKEIQEWGLVFTLVAGIESCIYTAEVCPVEAGVCKENRFTNEFIVEVE